MFDRLTIRSLSPPEGVVEKWGDHAFFKKFIPRVVYRDLHVRD